MAIRLITKPNTTAAGGDYPYGNIKNDTTPGSGDGTPVNVEVYADFHQFFAKLLDEAGITGNDLPENSANTFQYFEALKTATYEDWLNASELGYSNNYTNDGSNAIKYRRVGKTIRLKGQSNNSAPGSVSTNQTIFTLPSGFRPAETQLFSTWNSAGTPSPAVIQVTSAGVVSIRGDYQAVTNTGIWLNFSFDVD